MFANTTARAVSRVGAKRAMSESAGPKMHKAKDAWKTINATRPVDPHPHVSCYCCLSVRPSVRCPSLANAMQCIVDESIAC